MTRRHRLPTLALALVASAVAGCAAPVSAVAGDPAPVQDLALSASPTPSRTATSPSASATPVTPGSARTLVLPPLVRDEITTSWAAGAGLERDDVAGISPGTAYYGYMTSTGTYWAVASFDPTQAWTDKAAAAPTGAVATAFAGGPWVLSHRRGQGWLSLGGTGGRLCPPKVPAQMIAAWGLSTAGC